MDFRTSIESLDAEAERRLADVDLSLPDPTAEKPVSAALRAETPPGCCVGCDEPVLPRKKPGPLPRFCGAPECVALARDVWFWERNAAQTGARRAKFGGADGRTARHQS